MITVIDCDNKHLYREQLEEHYRIRHKIYVEDRRWMALERPDGRTAGRSTSLTTTMPSTFWPLMKGASLAARA
jgi:hypothetical protein